MKKVVTHSFKFDSVKYTFKQQQSAVTSKKDSFVDVKFFRNFFFKFHLINRNLNLEKNNKFSYSFRITADLNKLRKVIDFPFF